jgi:hypothetical protein
MSRDYRFSTQRGLASTTFPLLLDWNRIPLRDILASGALNVLSQGDLYTRDAAWARSGEWRSFLRENCCNVADEVGGEAGAWVIRILTLVPVGTSGCQALQCLFQMWDTKLDCTIENFAKYHLQIDRAAAAQTRLGQLLADPKLGSVFRRGPTPADAIPATLAACFNLGSLPSLPFESETDTNHWAAWCAEVMRLVGVFRWSTNMRWDLVREGNPALWAEERRFNEKLAGLFPDRQRKMRIDAPVEPGLISRTVPLPQMCDGPVPYYRSRPPSSRLTPSIAAVSGNVDQRAYVQSGAGVDPICDKGPGIRADFTVFQPVVPTSQADFDAWPIGGVAAPDGAASVPGRTNYVFEPVLMPFHQKGDELFRSFFWAMRPAGDTRSSTFATGTYNRFSEQTQQAVPGRSDLGTKLTALVWARNTRDGLVYYPSPMLQIAYCWALAMDAVKDSPGKYIEAGTTRWGVYYQAMPDQFKALSPAAGLEVNRQMAQANLDTAAGVVGAVGSTITSIVMNIMPIAGVIVMAVFATITALIRYAHLLCLETPMSPPCISPPFLRFSSVDTTQSQRCNSDTTGEGGAAAREITNDFLGRLAGMGLSAEDIAKTLEDTSTGVSGDGTNTNRSAITGTTIAFGVVAVGAVALLALALSKPKKD